MRVLAQCLVKRKTANKMNILNEYIASQTKINNTGIFVAILAPVFAELIRTSDWDQNLVFRLVFVLSEKTQRKTNPKSEVTHCVQNLLWVLLLVYTSDDTLLWDGTKFWGISMGVRICLTFMVHLQQQKIVFKPLNNVLSDFSDANCIIVSQLVI